MVDYRLNTPFKELVDYADSMDMSRMDTTEKSHVPFVVILLKVMQQWKNEVSLKTRRFPTCMLAYVLFSCHVCNSMPSYPVRGMKRSSSST